MARIVAGCACLPFLLSGVWVEVDSEYPEAVFGLTWKQETKKTNKKPINKILHLFISTVSVYSMKLHASFKHLLPAFEELPITVTPLFIDLLPCCDSATTCVKTNRALAAAMIFENPRCQ